MVSSFVALRGLWTTGHQYVELARIARYCADEGIETPLYVRWQMMIVGPLGSFGEMEGWP